jgi:hypothetical protein
MSAANAAALGSMRVTPQQMVFTGRVNTDASNPHSSLVAARAGRFRPRNVVVHSVQGLTL